MCKLPHPSQSVRRPDRRPTAWLPSLVCFLGLSVSTALAVPPNPPTNLTGNFSAGNKAILTWTDNSTDENEFAVDRATSSDFTQNLCTYRVGMNGTTLTTYGLTPGTTYWFRVRAYNYSLGYSANCAMNPPSGTTGNAVQDPVPSPFTFADIGAPALAGSVSFQAVSYDPAVPYCQYTLKGAGSGFKNYSDQFGYLYQTHYGDGEIVVKVNSMDNPNAAAKAGVMFRETTAAGSKCVVVALMPTNGVGMYYRKDTNSVLNTNATASGISAPCWLKLKRAGCQYSGYYSLDGRTWTMLGWYQSISFNPQLTAGLGVTSNNTSQLCTAKFSNFSVKRGADSVPFGGAPGDYEISWYQRTKTFVDRMKQCGGYYKTGTSTPATVDANGWPTEDFDVYVLQSLPTDIGTTYKLYADHVNQNPTISALGQGVMNDVYNKVYDSGNKTVTADVKVTLGGNVRLTMTNTGGGAKNVKLMLPGYNPDTTEVFNPLLKNLLGRCNAIRFIRMTATIDNQIRYWADRSHVSDAFYVTYFNGKPRGMPWELVVKLANETRRDIWIETPCLADDAYITNLANLIKYGSDGVTPYTSTQSNPVYPPLDSDLNVYVEHSNETWNSMFAEYQQCINEAKAYRANPYPTAGYQPVLEDQGTLSDYDLGFIWHVKRCVDISNLFKAVFGSSAINNRIKVIWALQRGGSALGRGMGGAEWVQRQYSAAPNTFLYSMSVETYHWPAENYFFYGLEARNNCTKQEVLDQVLAGANVYTSDLASIQYAAAGIFYGMKRTAYEGGLFMKDDIRRFTASSLTAMHDALNDSALATAMSTAATKYYQYGGNQWEYYALTAGSDGSFCVTDDLCNQNTPRLNGLDAVVTAAPPAVTIGHSLSSAGGEIKGEDHLASTGIIPVADLHSFTPSWGSAYYLVNAASSGNYNFSVRAYTPNANVTLDLAVNNAQKQSLPTLTPNGYGWKDTTPVSLSLTKGLNVIRLKATGNTNTSVGSLKFTTPACSGNLITWNMDGTFGANPMTSSTNAPGMNSSTLSRGSGLSAAPQFPNSWAFSGGTETSLANAVTNNCYATFTVTPNSGCTVTINSVSVYAWSRVSTGNYTLEAGTSGFGSSPSNNLGTWSVYAYETSPVAHTFTLANPIVTSTPVEFRFYLWGGTSNFGFGKAYTAPDGVTDLAITGSVTASGNLTNTLPRPETYFLDVTKPLNTACVYTVTPSDLETAAGNLTVTATSDNQVLAPNGNLVVTGAGTSSRNVTITPATDQYGKSRITVTVSDGSLSRSAGFYLTVNPTLTGDQQWVSLGKNGAASGLSDPVNGIRGSLAYDGNRSTSWVSPPTGFSFNGTWDIGLTGNVGTTQGHWVYVDLGAPKRIERVKLVFGSNYATDVKLQYTNDSPTWYWGTARWYDVPGGTVNGNTQQTVELTGLSVNQQILRIFVAARANTDSGVEIKEMEVYGIDPYTTNTKINCGGAAVSPFSADDGFNGGSVSSHTQTVDVSGVTNPAPQAVYQTERYGNHTYRVTGLTPGAQKTVRLHFQESYWTAAGQRKFDVKINNTLVLDDFDIFAATGAKYKAVVREFTATADTYGKIAIQFINVTDNAKVDGIEVN